MLALFDGDPAAETEAERSIEAAEAAIDEFEMAASFSGEFDAHDAIVSVFAGAGGVDAADWAQMLTRMYLRWAEAKGFSTQIVDESPAEEAGLKSITFFVRGRNAYGMLESERGVHRLVRLSPFDAAHRRHTSFAAVDVIPEVEAGEGERRDQAGRAARRDVQIGRRGRPIRQQNRIGRAHRAPADGHHRRLAAGALAGAESRGRADDPACQARGTGDTGAAKQTRRSARRAPGQRVGLADPLVRSAAIPAGEGSPHERRDGQRQRPCSTATSIRSSGRICSNAARAASLNLFRARSFPLDRVPRLRGALQRG